MRHHITSQVLDELGIGMSQAVPEAPSAAAEQEQKAGMAPDPHTVGEMTRLLFQYVSYQMTDLIFLPSES